MHTSPSELSIAPALSPFFIDFIAHWLDGTSFDGQAWVDQTVEALNSNAELLRSSNMRLERLITDEIAQSVIKQVYQWFYELCTIPADAVKKLHDRFKFIAIVGVPRTGGSYLTAEVFSSLGYKPASIPAIIAHDGFPDAHPYLASLSENSWIHCLFSMSEYLAILELYFKKHSQNGKILIPKKMTKAVYAGGFFNSVLGQDVEVIITVRHPIASCISTYEKSGGFPFDARFVSRSTIEKWIRRDVIHTGSTQEELKETDYFCVYIRYWEQFHINLAMSGLTSHRNYRIVPYGIESMQQTANDFHSQFGSNRRASNFIASGPLSERHPNWVARAQQAIDRVEGVWSLVGMPFPREQVLECH
jgi:hypothetical protein